MSKVYTKTGDGGTTALIGGERVSKADLRVEAYGTVDELSAHLALLADMLRTEELHGTWERIEVCGGQGRDDEGRDGEGRNGESRDSKDCDAEGRGGEFFEWLRAAFERIQIELMTVEALLATGRGGEGKVAGLTADVIRRLEREIDAMSAGLPPVGGFTLPGGHPALSQCHVCRTVCRRAERAAVRIADAVSTADAVNTDDDAHRAESLADNSAAAIPPAANAQISPEAYLNRLSDWLYTLGRRAAAELGIKEIYWIP